MSYLALARRYRPTRLVVEDPGPEFPFRVTLRPSMQGVVVVVERDGVTRERFVDPDWVATLRAERGASS
jgi:hypothetical protein